MPTTVQIDGLKELRQNLDKLPDETRRVIRNKLERAADTGRNVAIKRLTDKQSGFQSGNLRSTIAVRKRPGLNDLEAIVTAGGEETGGGGFDYSLAVEFGTKPHFPPVKALTGRQESLDTWVRRMNPSPDDGETQEEAEERVAFQIAKKISERGTKEMPYMRPGFNLGSAKFKKDIRSLGGDLNL